MNELSVLSYRGSSLFLKEIEKRKKTGKVLIPLLDINELISIMKVYVSFTQKHGEIKRASPRKVLSPKINHNNWTLEEELIVEYNYKSKEDIPVLLDLLNRSEKSIKRKLKRLGIWKE